MLARLARLSFLSLCVASLPLLLVRCGASAPAESDFVRAELSGEKGPPAAQEDGGVVPGSWTWREEVLADGTYRFKRLGEPAGTLTEVGLDPAVASDVRAFFTRPDVVAFLRGELPCGTNPQDTFEDLAVEFTGESRTGAFTNCSGEVPESIRTVFENLRDAGTP